MVPWVTKSPVPHWILLVCFCLLSALLVDGQFGGLGGGGGGDSSSSWTSGLGSWGSSAEDAKEAAEDAAEDPEDAVKDAAEDAPDPSQAADVVSDPSSEDDSSTELSGWGSWSSGLSSASKSISDGANSLSGGSGDENSTGSSWSSSLSDASSKFTSGVSSSLDPSEMGNRLSESTGSLSGLDDMLSGGLESLDANTLGKLTEKLKEVVNEVKELTEEVQSVVRDSVATVKNITNEVKGELKEIISETKQELKDSKNDLVETGQGLIHDTVGSVEDLLGTVRRDILENADLVEGITGSLSSVIDIAQKTISTVVTDQNMAFVSNTLTTLQGGLTGGAMMHSAGLDARKKEEKAAKDSVDTWADGWLDFSFIGILMQVLKYLGLEKIIEFIQNNEGLFALIFFPLQLLNPGVFVTVVKQLAQITVEMDPEAFAETFSVLADLFWWQFYDQVVMTYADWLADHIYISINFNVNFDPPSFLF